MNVLITGFTGQLGSEWVQFLKKKEIPFRAYSSGELDITNKNQVDQALKKNNPDILINCAAYTNVDGAESDSKKAFLVNETGVRNIAGACEAMNVKLVHYSTDYVFPGSETDQDKYPNGYPENAETNPINIYGKSKEAGEKILEKATCDWLLLRVSWLCGQYGANFVKTMLRLGSEKSSLSVVDDQVGCPSFAFDVVDKTWKLIEAKKNGIFHLSSDGKITWADLAEEIFQQKKMEVAVSRISSEEFGFSADRPRFSLLSTKKATESGLGILNWKNGLKQLLEQVEVNKS